MKTILFILAWTVTFLGLDYKLLGTAEVADGAVLTAIPNIPKEYCYKTLGWDDPTGMETAITQDTTFYALYHPLRYSLSIDTEHGYYLYGDIEAQGMSFDGNYMIEHILCGETVTVYAKPHGGYTFVKWVLNGVDQATTSSTFEVPMTEAVAQPVLNPQAGKDDGNVAIYAVFEVDPATDITDTKTDINASYKRIENNHVVIIRNGEKYDLTGRKIK